MAAGSSLIEKVRFTPKGLGRQSDEWVLNVDDGKGVRAVTFTGNGVSASCRSRPARAKLDSLAAALPDSGLRVDSARPGLLDRQGGRGRPDIR